MEKPQLQLHANGIDYVLVGDSYIPDSVFVYDKCYIGYYGHKRLEYLKEHDAQQLYKLKQEEVLLNHLIAINNTAIIEKERMLASLFENKTRCCELSKIEWEELREHYLRMEIAILCKVIYI